MRKTVLAIALRAAALGGAMRAIALATGVLLVGVAADAIPAAGQEPPGGRRGSGLPVPRYVSLKSERVNVRNGPTKDHDVAWVFTKPGLPVEITAEFEVWRRIRDAAGTEGWVLHSLLSGRRTALVTPRTKGEAEPVPLHERSGERAEVVARLQPGVIANVKQCGGAWCRIIVPQTDGGDLDGYIRQDRLWGVYPNEKVE